MITLISILPIILQIFNFGTTRIEVKIMIMDSLIKFLQKFVAEDGIIGPTNEFE